jgi:hypothetical protein
VRIAAELPVAKEARLAAFHRLEAVREAHPLAQKVENTQPWREELPAVLESRREIDRLELVYESTKASLASIEHRNQATRDALRIAEQILEKTVGDVVAAEN